MKPPPFRYVRPSSVDEALAALSEHGDEAKVIAGGQSLVPMMNLRLARPAVLVDINTLPLDDVHVEDDRLRLGATVRQSRLIADERIGAAVPLLSRCARFIAHPAIRTRGTVCGSLCHADPTAELPLASVLLGGRVQLSSTRGTREVEADRFFVGAFTTTVEPDELVVGVTFPVERDDARVSFVEISERAGDFALAAVAARVTLSNGALDDVAIGVAGGGAAPVRATAAEDLLAGAEPSAEALRQAASVAVDGVEPAGDVHASAGFRRRLLGVMVERGLQEAIAGAMS
ncbi:MAG TPA: xanthine dehydrogenase family protein subunit M [Egibacteraceae bacterium]|nr:xanthine dehydrogenase family protein subunit M [Egibacteraceae bacterium]